MNGDHLPSLNLEYEQYGNPLEVLKLQSRPVRGQLESDEVRVRWLAAPVNPLDINKLEGNYPIKLPFPIIAGSEGV